MPVKPSHDPVWRATRLQGPEVISQRRVLWLSTLIVHHANRIRGGARVRCSLPARGRSCTMIRYGPDYGRCLETMGRKAESKLDTLRLLHRPLSGPEPHCSQRSGQRRSAMDVEESGGTPRRPLKYALVDVGGHKRTKA